MMQRVPFQDISEGIRLLFDPLDGHLAVASMLAGLTPGAVYVDDPAMPALGIAWFHSRVYLCGDLQTTQAQQEVRACFAQELVPQMLAAQMSGFILHTEPTLPDEIAADILPKYRYIRALRRHYTCRRLRAEDRAALPVGYGLGPINAGLLSEPGLSGLDWLREEMVSERASVEDFLEKSFGVCLTYQNEIVGWCLSEYNREGRCEVGVAIAEAHQRCGLGTTLTLAFVEAALAHGYHEIGWHCWTENRPSAALAERCGFELQKEFPVWYWIIRPPETS
jgi:RimJ/RimL family protein N-acetyltransferase